LIDKYNPGTDQVIVYERNEHRDQSHSLVWLKFDEPVNLSELAEHLALLGFSVEIMVPVADQPQKKT